MRAITPDIPAVLKFVAERFIYDEANGVFYYSMLAPQGRIPGDIAGSWDYRNKQYKMHVCGRPLLRPKLIWLLHHSVYPEYPMRYKNGNIQDHRISNLFVSDKPRAPKKTKHKAIIPSNGKLPDNIRFMERRNQYRLDIPGKPARY